MTTTTLTQADIFNVDIKTVLDNDESFLLLKSNIEKAVKESEEIQVLTPGDLSNAAIFVKKFKKIASDTESLRKKIKQPFLDKGSEIDTAFKKIPEMFEEEQKRLEKGILDFKHREEVEARRIAEEERKKREEDAIEEGIKEENRRKKEAEEKGVPIEDIIPVEPAIVSEVIAKETKLSRLTSVKISSAKYKTFEIFDESLLPREYLMPNPDKIKAERSKFEATNQDGSEIKSTIPGVRFTYKEGIR